VAVAVGFGDTEIDQVSEVVRSDDDVLGLDVTVDKARGVSGVEC